MARKKGTSATWQICLKWTMVKHRRLPNFSLTHSAYSTQMVCCHGCCSSYEKSECSFPPLWKIWMFFFHKMIHVTCLAHGLHSARCRSSFGRYRLLKLATIHSSDPVLYRLFWNDGVGCCWAEYRSFGCHQGNKECVCRQKLVWRIIFRQNEPFFSWKLEVGLFIISPTKRTTFASDQTEKVCGESHEEIKQNYQ